MPVAFLDYRPRGAAREIFRCRADEVVITGPAGTGKTRGVLEKFHFAMDKYPGARSLVIRKTRTSLTTTGLVTYQQNVLPPGAADVSYQGASYPNGSQIAFGGMDKASKIMSSEYDLIFVQEATELAEEEWESLTTRLRWGRMPYQQIIGDVNPGPATHWIKRRANAGKVTMLESRHEDNPMIFNDDGQVTERGKAYLAKLDALTGVRYLRLRLGIWAAAEGMVYTGWDVSKHLIDRFDIPREWPRIWVLDFGYTNPFVWQAWARDPDGRLYRYREIYQTQRLVEDHCKEIRELCKKHNEPVPVAIICDHDAEDRATFERHMGLPTAAAFKSIRPGIQAVQSRLKTIADGKPRLMFLRDSLLARDEDLYDAKLPVCSEEEIEAYCWPKSGTGASDTAESPVKRDDHGMDAMRYVVAFADGIASDPSRQQSQARMHSGYRISSI